MPGTLPTFWISFADLPFFRLKDAMEESSDIGKFNRGASGTTDDVSSVTLRPKIYLDWERDSSCVNECDALF